MKRKARDEQIEKLFERFQDIWDQKWAVKLAERREGLLNEWAESLAGYSDEVLYEAGTLAKEKYNWPPEISEFLELCRAAQASKPVVVKPVAEIPVTPNYVFRLVEEGENICKLLMQQNPGTSWQEIGEMFAVYKHAIRKENPEFMTCKC